MGWFTGLIKRLTTGHAQGMDNVAMFAVQRCASRFPDVFDTDPWDSPPFDSLERLHEDAEYLLADRSLHSAFKAIVSTGDNLNAAIALVERAKLHTRVRDWRKAERSTEEAVAFCCECSSQDPANTEISQLYIDSLVWRGAFLQFGKRQLDDAKQVYEKAKVICRRFGDEEGLSLIASFWAHIK